MSAQEIIVTPCHPMSTLRRDICAFCYKDLNKNIPSIVCHAQTEEGRYFAAYHPYLVDLLIRPTTSTQFIRDHLRQPFDQSDVDYVEWNAEILCFCGEVWKGKRNLWIHLLSCPIIHMVDLSPELAREFRSMAAGIHTGELAMIRQLEDDEASGRSTSVEPSTEGGDDDDDDEDDGGDGDDDAGDGDEDGDRTMTDATSVASSTMTSESDSDDEGDGGDGNTVPLVPAPGTLPNNPHGVAVPNFLNHLTTDRRITAKSWARTAVRVFNTGRVASHQCENCARRGKTCVVSRDYVRCAGCTKLNTWCRGTVAGEVRPARSARSGEAEAPEERESDGEKAEGDEGSTEMDWTGPDGSDGDDDPGGPGPGGGGFGDGGHAEAQPVAA